MSKRAAYTLTGIILLLIVWWGFSFFAGRTFIPYPWEIFYATLLLLGRLHTWQQIGITLYRVLAGFGLAFLAGTVLGILCGRSKAFAEISRPTLFFLQAMPPLLWVIPIILVLGLGGVAPLLVIFLIVTPLVVIHIQEGTRSLPRALSELVKIYAPGFYPNLREVILPSLKPFLIGALKTGLLTGLKASVVGEYFGANNGIGFQIQTAFQAVMMQRLFCWSLLLIFLLWIFSRLSQLVQWFIRSRQTRREAVIKAYLTGAAVTLSRAQHFTALHADNISFAYKKHTHLILSGINLTVPPQQIAVLTGDSGTGKTTFLHLLAGLVSPLAGSITRPAHVAIQFQDNRLLPWRTVLYNAGLPLLYSGLPAAEAFRLSARLLEKAGLGSALFQFPDQLSGGMQRRALFVQCFGGNPDLILLDEPFTGLHKTARQELWSLFLEFWDRHRCPVVIVTHFPEELGTHPFLHHYRLAGKPAGLQ